MKRNPAGSDVVLTADQPPAKTASKKKAVSPQQQGKFHPALGGRRQQPAWSTAAVHVGGLYYRLYLQ
ncbi:MAG: hypothetical protein ACKOTF_17925, partial [Opitutaceae bacterium]